MNNQEGFNCVWEYFIINNNPKGVTDNMSHRCVYYDHITNKKCAIGCLFDEDSLGKVQLLTGTIEDLIYKIKWVNEYFSDMNISLLSDLQKNHDRLSVHQFNKNFKKALETIAKEYELTIPTE